MLTWYTVGSGTPRGRRPGLLCSFGHFREVEDAAKEAKETLYTQQILHHGSSPSERWPGDPQGCQHLCHDDHQDQREKATNAITQ